jgi:hypothetical protein
MRRIVLLSVFAASAAVAQPTGVAPFVDCVYLSPSGNLVTAFFGYNSVNSGSVTVPVGSSNHVTPSPVNWGQVTTFAPGIQHDAWIATFDLTATSSITWSVLGMSVTASNDSTLYCTMPVGTPGLEGAQGPAGDQGPTGLPGLPGVMGPTGPRGATGPQGATGLPGLPGLTGLAGRGATGAQGLAGPKGPTGPQGAIGPQGPQGPAGPPGPSAVLPVIRVVVADGDSEGEDDDSVNRATASCNEGEVFLGGGGICTASGAQLASSLPTGSGWTVSCDTGAARAVAVCAGSRRDDD